MEVEIRKLRMWYQKREEKNYARMWRNTNRNMEHDEKIDFVDRLSTEL